MNPDDRKQDNPDLQGEGNYTAARHYNEATKRYVEEGKVDAAAAAAQPGSAQEERDLESAEEEGKSHAKEEDPALRRPGRDARRDGGQGAGQDPEAGADRDRG
jgi:hypothetical protein